MLSNKDDYDCRQVIYRTTLELCNHIPESDWPDKIKNDVMKGLDLGCPYRIKDVLDKSEHSENKITHFLTDSILTINASRTGIKLTVQACGTEEVIDALPGIIQRLLDLANKSDRNEILSRAIELSDDDNDNTLSHMYDKHGDTYIQDELEN